MKLKLKDKKILIKLVNWNFEFDTNDILIIGQFMIGFLIIFILNSLSGFSLGMRFFVVRFILIEIGNVFKRFLLRWYK